MNPLVEYLYVDEPRLDRYLEQIHAGPIYEKVSDLRAEFGLTGPKVLAGQSRHARPLNRHEKVKALVSYLDEHHLLADHRSQIYMCGLPAFCREIVQASCYRVPRPGDGKVAALTLWLTSAKSNEGLCLLLDYRGPDESPLTRTAYTYSSRPYAPC